MNAGEQSAKRRRAGELGLLAATPPPPEAFLPSPPGTAATPLLRPDGEEDEELAGKPDVFEFFAQRNSRQRELEEEVARLQQREAQLGARLVEAELAASRARDAAATASARQEAREAQLELQLQEQQEALQLEVERAAGLSQQLRAAEAAAEAAARRAAAAEAEAAAVAAAPHGGGAVAGHSAATELQLQVTQLQLQLEQLAADKEESERRTEVALRTAQQRLDGEAATARLLQQQLEEAVGLAEAGSAERHALEAALAGRERELVEAQAQLEAARSAAAGGGADGVLVRSLRDQLREQGALVAEARRLKEQASNVLVLREQLERAEARARAAEELLPDAAELQGRLEAAEQQLQRWRLVLEGAAECGSPEDVLHLLNRLQRQQMEAAVQVGDKAEEVAQLRSAAEAADAARAEAERAREEAVRGCEETAVALSRAERKLALLGRERDGLQAILASYDEEYLNTHGSELGPQQKRIVELEAQVAALHAHARGLEEELAGKSSAAAGASGAVGEAAARAEAAEARARSAEAEAENLAKQVALLQERVGRGEYNAATTRVLHFKYNPEAELAREARDARLAELEAENEALREAIQRLEAAAAQGQAEAAAPAAGSMRVAQLEGEANLLRRKVAELQKGMDRLQQVFNRQITLFREAMYLLFGYRVEMATDPGARDFKAQFTLRPAHYADEGPSGGGSGGGGAQLVFRMLRDNRMVLVPTEFSARLQREVETFIDRFRSIPAFTANLTMECFQKQTQC